MNTEPLHITYGVTRTKHGFEPCILQEDGLPLMTSGHPFKSERDALQEALRLTMRSDLVQQIHASPGLAMLSSAVGC